jgi:MFS transporter, PPP family, 3-phenylpropionic acid transporter
MADTQRYGVMMLKAKALYFFFFAGGAALIPFLPLYYQQAGLTGGQIGLLAGLPPLINIFGGPIWSGFADATRLGKRLLLFAVGGVVVMVFTLSQTTTFLFMIPIVITYAFFISPVIPMVDNNVLRMLGERKDQYGRQRLWGAVGWGIAAPTLGIAAERYGLQWNFIGFVILFSCVFLIISRWPMKDVPLANRFWSSLRVLLANRQLAVFLLAVFVSGVTLSMTSNYLFLHLDGLGATRTLMGVSLTFATVSEIPVLFFSDRLLKRFDARWLILFSLIVFALRAFAYSIMSTPWVVMPIQLTHGLTFSVMWVAGVSYVNEIAPDGLGTTAQSLFSSVTMGLGAMVGGFAGGILYQYYGSAVMFRVASISVLIFVFAFLFSSRGKAKTTAG